MPDSIAFAKNYIAAIDEVYQRAGVSGVLNSGRQMVRAGHNAKEIMIPKISVTGLGDYTRNVGYKTGAITYEFETKTFTTIAASGSLPTWWTWRRPGSTTASWRPARS